MKLKCGLPKSGYLCEGAGYWHLGEGVGYKWIVPVGRCGLLKYRYLGEGGLQTGGICMKVMLQMGGTCMKAGY